MSVELLHMYRWTDWEADMTELTDAFRNFANAPKNPKLGDYLWFVWISVQTVIISLYSSNWFLFISETRHVYYVVQANFLKIDFRLILLFKVTV